MAKKKKNIKNKGNNKKKMISNFPSKKEEKAIVDGVVEYEEGITVDELSQKIGQTPANVIKVLFMLGTMVTINSSLDDEQVALICMEYGLECKKVVPVSEVNFEDLEVVDDPKDLEPRPPVITIMGHVDHGKTTLLDHIRKSRVAEGEFGGITQHIGAYQVSVKGKKITFLDTPGHEAFTAMRARGAMITDIVIIVVAADDGVMPQTREAVDHALAAGVPIIVAVNKIDKPGADPQRIMTEVSELGLMPEEWGGDTIFTQVSAKKGTGVPELLETMLLVADMQELKANPDTNASGTVIEAKLDKGRGPVATVLVQRGTLHTGDSVVVGTSYGRVRKMTNDRGMEIKHAEPSCPVEIIGLNEVPRAGDVFMSYDSYKKAAEIAGHRLDKQIEKERNSTSAMSLEDLAKKIDEGDVQEINVLIKADVQGSAEALKASMEKLEVDGNVRINVIRSTVGTITESDILLASASNAIIYGFNIRPSAAIRKKAEEEGVEIRLHNIIYKALEELQAAMKGMLAPVYEEVVIGQADVRQIYKVSKIGTIAGCMVTDGKIKRDCKVRLIREGIVIYTGKLGSLRRFDNDVKEVINGYECGMTIENFNDIKVGDIIEGFEDQEVEE